VVKPLDAFARHHTAKDGHRYDCKECVSARKRSERPLWVAAVAEQPTVRSRPAAGMKICRVCSAAKPLHAFGVHPRTFDGRLHRCEDCVKKPERRTRAAPSEAGRVAY
jgi:hypothetical protein